MEGRSESLEGVNDGASTMTRVEIEDALYNWVNGVVNPLGATVLFADQDFPRVGTPFVTIKIGTQRSLALMDEHSTPVGVTGVSTITGERTMEATIEAYGSGAFDLMYAIEASLSKDEIRNSLYYTGGLAVWNTEGVLNLTEMIDTNYEPRFAMDIKIGYKHIDTEVVSWIETVEITGFIDTLVEIKQIGPFTVSLT